MRVAEIFGPQVNAVFDISSQRYVNPEWFKAIPVGSGAPAAEATSDEKKLSVLNSSSTERSIKRRRDRTAVRRPITGFAARILVESLHLSYTIPERAKALRVVGTELKRTLAQGVNYLLYYTSSDPGDQREIRICGAPTPLRCRTNNRRCPFKGVLQAFRQPFHQVHGIPGSGTAKFVSLGLSSSVGTISVPLVAELLANRPPETSVFLKRHEQFENAAGNGGANMSAGEGQPPPEQQLQPEAFIPEDFCDEGQREILSLGCLSVSCLPVFGEVSLSVLLTFSGCVATSFPTRDSAENWVPPDSLFEFNANNRHPSFSFSERHLARLLASTDDTLLRSRVPACSVRLHG